MYVHEISGFDTDFYALDESGSWQPNLVEDWISSTTPPANLRSPGSLEAGPFQRTHVIANDSRPVGFVCVGVPPFRYMPSDADVHVAELFLIHAARGSGLAGRALQLLLERYPGRWHLRALHDNHRAIAFWQRALRSLGVAGLEENREDRDVVFRFVVGG